MKTNSKNKKCKSRSIGLMVRHIKIIGLDIYQGEQQRTQSLPVPGIVLTGRVLIIVRSQGDCHERNV